MIGCDIADETTDKRKLSPVNMLIAPAKLGQKEKPFLADIQFVDAEEEAEEEEKALPPKKRKRFVKTVH